jgi:hypothetical protein
MNVTLVVCALAMGGWVMPDPVDTTPPLFEDMSQPPKYMPRYNLEIAPPDIPPKVQPPPGIIVEPPPRIIGREFPPPVLDRGSPDGSTPGKKPVMPIAPTDPSAATSDLFPVMPTTPNPVARPGLLSTPTNPSRPPGSHGGGVQPSVTRPPAVFGPLPQNAQNTLLGQKAFQNVRPAALPAPSPWGGLFLRTGGVTTDNYDAYVVPALDQASINQRQSVEIGGLQNTVQQQRTAPPSGQVVPTGEGFVIPNSFNNLGSYFSTPAPPPVGQ